MTEGGRHGANRITTGSHGGTRRGGGDEGGKGGVNGPVSGHLVAKGFDAVAIDADQLMGGEKSLNLGPHFGEQTVVEVFWSQMGN